MHFVQKVEDSDARGVAHGAGMNDQVAGMSWAMLFVALLVFLVCREVVCWYFKLSRIADSLTRIERLLAQAEAVRQAEFPGLRPAPEETTWQKVKHWASDRP